MVSAPGYGFTGVNCAVDIDECAPNPCLNGGICDGTAQLLKKRRLARSITKDWGHRFAHARLPRAGLLPLLLSATNTALQFVVLAAISQRRLPWTGAIGPTGQRWTGPNCEVPPRACPPGLEGPRCSTDVDECASFPCRKSHDRSPGIGLRLPILTAMLVRAENGATCLESSVHGPVATGFYQCECAVGWHGANCASDVRPRPSSALVDPIRAQRHPCGVSQVNECNSQPCRNGAECTEVPQRATYSCTCGDGWAGWNW